MSSYTKLIIEAIFVGVITVLVGYVAGYIVGRFEGRDLPQECKNWNQNYVMEKSLFLTGFIVHVLCEMSGINKWYCTNGNACLA